MPPTDRGTSSGDGRLLSGSDLDRLLDSYLDLTWNLDPAAATAAGVMHFDHRLGLFDTESVDAHVAALQSIAGSLEEVEVTSLDDEIDRTALLNTIRVGVHRFSKERPHERNPVFWLGHVLESLHTLMVFQDRSPEHVASSLARRHRNPQHRTDTNWTT